MQDIKSGDSRSIWETPDQFRRVGISDSANIVKALITHELQRKEGKMLKTMQRFLFSNTA